MELKILLSPKVLIHNSSVGRKGSACGNEKQYIIVNITGNTGLGNNIKGQCKRQIGKKSECHYPCILLPLTHCLVLLASWKLASLVSPDKFLSYDFFPEVS